MDVLCERRYNRGRFQAGRNGVLRVDTRVAGRAESGVVDAVRRMGGCGVVPDVREAESPAMRDGKRIHALNRNKYRG